MHGIEWIELKNFFHTPKPFNPLRNNSPVVGGWAKIINRWFLSREGETFRLR